MTHDFLIVGQGLAGSLLAFELLQRDYRVLIVDNGAENASQIAAGLINPVTGLRLVKSRGVERLLNAAPPYYRELGRHFNQEFWVDLPMLRVLQSEDESQHARRRLAQPGYRPFLRDILPAPAGVTAPFGVLRQANTGYLLTRQLLACLQAFFSARDCYRRMELEYWRLTSDGAGWRWGDINARNIVFCEGYLAANNPWFGQLPFQCVKGEILTADMTADCPPWILNYRHWLLPLTAKRFKTGASFEPGVTDIETTPALKSRFFNAAQAVYPQAGPLTLLEHKAGVRPATLDKQPFVGAHPQQSNLFIFNGFGAKGGVAIPWHARHFADVFERRAAMAAHCDVQRHAAQLLA